MSSACSSTSKILLVVVGLLFWAAAAGLFFIGGWVMTTYHHYDEFTKAHLTLLPAAIILSVGFLMFLIGLTGFLSACKESKFLLATFFSLVVIVLTFEAAAGALGYAYKDDIKTAVSNGLNDALNYYSNKTEYRDQFDYLQEQVECCGVVNASDWMHSTTWTGKQNRTVPRSCCMGGPENTNCTAYLTSDKIYTDGCLTELQDKFLSNLVYIAGVTIAFAGIQILGLISSCILICRSKEVRYHTLQSGGLRA